ncbi:MAPEG family protein [Undibacter mobilis]|uniref:Glutathione metabolism protein n=1 Tax=Undibacter mobilis TaxID=2292256 RepID=A0A371B6U0_9BRAD|nr:MAPEG family protein [Undibacter mobilis]RDV03309.1 glutathione metabolism protein [Undibacter mobilis]
MPLIVPAYAAVLGLLFAVLSFRVANTRRVMRIGLGSGGDRQLERYIRVQANFAEYVPMALILLAFLEVQAWPEWLLHTLCALLLIARVVHALGVAREPEDIRFRASGMVATLAVLIVTSVLLLAGGIWQPSA